MNPSSAFTSKLNSDEVFAFISPLGEGVSAFYLATVKKATELLILDALRKNIFITAGISIAITILLALLLAEIFSKSYTTISKRYE